jgi:hypothetical protein
VVLHKEVLRRVDDDAAVQPRRQRLKERPARSEGRLQVLQVLTLLMVLVLWAGTSNGKSQYPLLLSPLGHIPISCQLITVVVAGDHSDH